MPEIASLSNRHVAILEFMMANPTMKLGEVAKKFDVSQPWLSCIIHSDAFQRQLRERQDATFNHTVLPLREKMQAVAHKMLDKVLDADVAAMDTDTAAEIGVDMLDRLGYSPKAPASLIPPQLADMVQVQRERLANARNLIGTRSTLTMSLEVTNEVPNEAQPLENRVGGVQERRSLPAIEGEYSSSKTGTGV